MTNRYDPASSAKGRAAAEEARLLLGRAGKARDEDQDKPKGDASEEELVEADRDDDELDDEDTEDGADRDDEEEDEEADKRAGHRSVQGAARAAVVADRARASKVMELARAAGLPNFGRRHVDYGTSVREFRKALSERQGKPGGRNLHERPGLKRDAARGAAEAKLLLGRK